MPVFPKPATRYAYEVEAEREHLCEHQRARGGPRKGPGRRPLGSRNSANCGAQLRRECDIRLLAEVLSWFDLIAVQECRENFGDLYDMVAYMGDAVSGGDVGGGGHQRAA